MGSHHTRVKVTAGVRACIFNSFVYCVAGLLCVVCMQMRNAVKATRDGYVDEVLVKQGEIVAADQQLLKFW